LQSGAGRAQEGQSITELALFFPVLLLIMVGMLDLGRAFHVYTTVVNAAREGARYGAFYPDDDFGIQDAVVQEATGSNINLSLATIIVEKPSGVGSGNPIRVTVTFQFDPVTTLVVGANTIGISGSASMPQF
jgi:Flp pilus assembly protein TadG